VGLSLTTKKTAKMQKNSKVTSDSMQTPRIGTMAAAGAVLEAIAEKVRQYMIGCKAMRRLRLLGKLRHYT
jgi:hypothetical protein